MHPQELNGPSIKEARLRIQSIVSVAELAELIGVDKDYLTEVKRNIREYQRYITFSVPKRTGGERLIEAPIKDIKKLQERLLPVFTSIYKQKGPVHGFAKEKNVVTNASPHQYKRFVFNIDIKDFFPSITFPRVQGMLIGKPYFLDPGIARFITSICCFNGHIPQGAPTSPILSNMICGKLDSNLTALARQHKCYYTRYADDITFSTNLSTFPSAIATTNTAEQVEVGEALASIVINNGFVINDKKVKLYKKNTRQEVTGLTVNVKPNVSQRFSRRVRAMLHAWRTHGYENAERHFLDKYDKKKRRIEEGFPIFKHVLRGRIEYIGMVKGKSDSTYLNFLYQFEDLENGITEKRKLPTTVSPEDIQNYHERLAIHRKHLRILLTQLASHGALAPTYVYFQIEEQKTNIKSIKLALRNWSIFAIDHPDDE